MYVRLERSGEEHHKAWKQKCKQLKAEPEHICCTQTNGMRKSEC